MEPNHIEFTKLENCYQVRLYVPDEHLKGGDAIVARAIAMLEHWKGGAAEGTTPTRESMLVEALVCVNDMIWSECVFGDEPKRDLSNVYARIRAVAQQAIAKHAEMAGRTEAGLDA